MLLWFRMPRTSGARNLDYDQQRWALARKVRQLVFAEGGLNASLRQLAVAADTSVSNLKHYFRDRDGVISAVLQSQQIDAAPYLAMASIPTHGDLRRSLDSYVAGLREAWFVHGVGNIQARALAAGLASQPVGPAYVNAILEPLLQSLEQRLGAHIQSGQMVRCDARFAALQLLSPIVLGLLHQDSLSGKSCRPLDLDAFLARHLDVFVEAHAERSKKRS
jgi:AcrR family transcriptional regulator